MAKHEDNAIIYLLCVVIGIAMVFMFFLLLQLMTVDAKLIQHKKEVDRVMILLHDEREKFKQAKKENANE